MNAAFAKALAEFQSELPGVGKDQTATVKSDKGQYQYSYADLTTITEKVMPLLSKHGLSFSARPTIGDHGFVLAYSLLHESGEGVEGFYPLPANGTAQQIGSAITYGRRYCLCAATGVAPGGEDDDGAAASQAPAQPRQQAPKPSTKPPLLEAKERLWSIAQRIGWDKGDLAVNYAKDCDDKPIGTATPAELNKWADELEKDLAASKPVQEAPDWTLS